MDNATISKEIIETKRDDLKKVDPRNIIVEDGFNVRKDLGDIVGLAHSVMTDGVIVPVEGYKVRGEDKYILTDGHRRLAAVLLALKFNAEGKAGFEDVSKIQLIRLIPSSSNIKDRLYIMAITGEKKKDLTEIEKAEMYSRLVEYGIAEGKKRGEVIKEICTRLCVSPASVYNTLKLNALPQEIKTAIVNKEISGGTVTTIIREIKDEAEQIKAVEAAITQAKSVAKEGGKSKATARDVKGLKAKSPMQRLREVAEKIEENGLTNSNSRTKLLVELLVALEEKKSVNKILELFV